MPSSTPKILSNIIEKILAIQPQRILDVGIGFGKWGFLCREYLECWKDRVHPKDWKVIIDGIEIWTPYVDLPWIKVLYNTIYIGDACDVVSKLSNYDLIIASDIIEHIEKYKGLALLDELYQRTNKCLVINIPIGPAWLHNVVVDNNPYEKHVSIWNIEELQAFGVKSKAFVSFSSWETPTRGGVIAFFIRNENV